jgi:uncharacterized protein (TIGR00369 family)
MWSEVQILSPRPSIFFLRLLASTFMSLSQTQPTSYFGLTIPFLDFIGVVPDFAENGKSRICLDLRPEHLNSFQVGHGGLSMTLLDFAMAAAARSVHPDAKGMVTIDMTVSFMRPSTGKLIIEGKLLKAGKNINYCEGEVINEAGVVTAKALGSFMMRR